MQSAIGTTVEKQDGKIIKTIHIDLFGMDRIRTLISDYVDQLKYANIPIPKIYGSHVKENKLIYVCQDVGENIDWNNYIREMLNVLYKAKNNNVCIDPHPRNFMMDENKKIWYVDFTPPYSEDYFNARLDMAKSSEKKLLENHFSLFKPDNLIQHFIADIYKTNSKIEEIITAEKRRERLGVKLL